MLSGGKIANINAQFASTTYYSGWRQMFNVPAAGLTVQPVAYYGPVPLWEPQRRLRPSHDARGWRCHWTKQPEGAARVPMQHGRGIPFRGHWLGQAWPVLQAVGS